MEALANLGIDWKLLVAQLVNFLVLLFVLKKFAYGPMLAFLEKRSERIEQGLRDAQAAQEKLRSMEETEKRVLEEARRAARSLIAEAEAAAKKRDAQRLAETEERASRFLAEAENRIAEEKSRMLAAAKKEIASTVTLAVEKVLREKIDSEKDRELITRMIAK